MQVKSIVSFDMRYDIFCVEPPALAKNFRDACPKPETPLASVAAVQRKACGLGGRLYAWSAASYLEVLLAQYVGFRVESESECHCTGHSSARSAE